jgi:hypothetical protein
MDVYSINPNPEPQASMTGENHSRTLNLLIIIVVAAIIVGLLYWWSASVNNSHAPAVASNLDNERAQVAAALRSSPVHVSQQQIDNIATQLRSSPVTVTDAQKQAIANSLREQ